MTSKDAVAGFFSAFGSGDFEGVLNAFDDNVKIVAVREGALQEGSLYGTYEGREGLQAFLSGMGSEFNTQAFDVANVMGEGNVAFANGSFTHEIKKTGKLFSSDWALMCVVENGKIKEYHFFEDSQSYTEANQ